MPDDKPNNSTNDDIDFIDPVSPKDQVEQQDPFFKQMGDDQNTKLIEEDVDDDEPIGSPNGEYENDDENADENPPKEAILHEIPEKKKR